MKRWGKWVLIVVASICLVTGGYAWYLYHSVRADIEKTYEPIPITHSEKPEVREPEKPVVHEVPIPKKAPVTILLLGVDETPSDKGRSDTMIVLAANPEKKSMLLFSIPRDTRTELIGKGGMDKINHAYAFGGVEMSIKTVESFLQIPIDYYVKVNMREFVKVIDILGGVQVENKLDFQYENHSFVKGPLLLNGEEALAYSRMRYDDPKGDLGRNERQQQVVRSLMIKGETPEILTNVQSIFDNIAKSVKTNITFDEMKDLVLYYKPAMDHLNVLEVKGSNRLMNGIYYYVVTPEERKRIGQQLKEVLNAENAPNSKNTE